MAKVLYIINPAGHGGTGSNTWESFKALWPNPIDEQDVMVTEGPGHAQAIASAARGYDIIAAVGGDGTVGEVFSGILEQDEPRPKLAIIPGGTGNDIGRNVGIGSIEDAVRALQDGQVRKFDLIRVDSDAGGQPVHKYAFLAIAVGFSSIPMIRPWMKRLLGPTGAYYLATVLQVIAYRPHRMRVRADGQEYSGHDWMIIIGNAERTAGGSMCLAPGARTDDGELNLTIISAEDKQTKSKLKMFSRVFPKIASGEHIHQPGVSYFPVKQVEIESTPPAILELDGDLFGTTPATISVCPMMLEVMSFDLPAEKAPQ